MQLQEIIDKHAGLPENLVDILLEYQSTKDNNSLSEDELKYAAKELNIPESRVYSVASFYSLLSLKPRGKYIIQVCNNVPCYVNGSANVVKELENRLKIKMGETTPDNLFTLEFTSCLGCCDLSPVVRIGKKLFGNLNRKRISEIILFYRRKVNENKRK